MSEVTCRGAFALGTACGKCSRCRREIESYNAMKAVRDKLNTPSSALSSIAKLEAENADLKAKLAKAVKLIELAIELGQWKLNPSFRDELIAFTAELTSSEAANGEAKGGKDE